MLSYKRKLALQFLSSTLKDLQGIPRKLYDPSLLRLSVRHSGFGLQYLFSTNAWICQNIKNTITYHCSLATIPRYTFIGFKETNTYFELGHSFNFLPFICIIIVMFFNTTSSPVNRIYLILNSIYTYQLNMLIETVLRQRFIMRRSGKNNKAWFGKKKKGFSYTVS